jgi:hypothetical protein
MSRLVFAMVVLVGCASGDGRTITLDGDGIDVTVIGPISDGKVTAPDVCALAAQLPSTNLCSLICDVDAMKAAMLAAGDHEGRCYEFDCKMPDASSVYVGVCLSPPPPATSTPAAGALTR